ncbi:MAG: hypothetical protein CM15mP74_16320 [Halieaceae bacterium]|nr:MAG: hypothetical protein CM15mP74_16320 [Halieaceae bacterium]
MPRWQRQELRSDHAGEYGAVMIYRGILAVSRDAQARQFAERHLVTEARHLKLWRRSFLRQTELACYPLARDGVVDRCPACAVWSQAIFATIEAVETFVDPITRSKLCAWAMRG